MSKIQELQPLPPNTKEISFLVESYKNYNSYVNFWMSLHDFFSNFSLRHRPFSTSIELLAQKIESYQDNQNLQDIRENISQNIKQYQTIREIARLDLANSLTKADFNLDLAIIAEIDEYLDRILSIYRLLLALKPSPPREVDISSLLRLAEKQILLISFDTKLPTAFIDLLEANQYHLKELDNPQRDIYGAIQDINLLLVIPPESFGTPSYLAFDALRIARQKNIPAITLIIKDQITFATMPDGFVRIIHKIDNAQHMDWLLGDIERWANP